MLNRMFDNPRRLTIDVIRARLAKLDTAVSAELLPVVRDQAVTPDSYIRVTSAILSDAQIDTKLQAVSDLADADVPRQAASKVTMQGIPNWATWSQADLLAWWTAHLAPAVINALAIPAPAKAVLNDIATALLAVGQVDIALRDRIWPDLPD